jgi:hypothetical protein
MALVIVDAQNVRRSEWPNISPQELVEAVGRWAADAGHEPLIVFDGRAPEGAVGVRGETADDWIARRAAELEEPFWVVTSDRGLRERIAGRAERLVGGGSFARELRPYRE